MKKIFVSQHCNNKTAEDMRETIERNRNRIAAVLNEEFEIVDSIIIDAIGIKPSLWYLAKALEIMSECDVVVFVEDWRGKRGCEVEYCTAKGYGLQIIELD